MGLGAELQQGRAHLAVGEPGRGDRGSATDERLEDDESLEGSTTLATVLHRPGHTEPAALGQLLGKGPVMAGYPGVLRHLGSGGCLLTNRECLLPQSQQLGVQSEVHNGKLVGGAVGPRVGLYRVSCPRTPEKVGSSPRTGEANVPHVRILAPRGRSLADQPARFVVVAFVAAIAVGTTVLSLPISTADGKHTAFLDALFTATSAICVTGLVVVDTGTHWSLFGKIVIMMLFQLGGLGFMTLASLIVLAVSRRLGIRHTLAAQTERRSLSYGDVRSVLRGVAVITLVVEVTVWLILTVRLMAAYDYSLRRALWHGLFHSVSAFNNAGFALHSDSLMRFANDPVVTIPMMIAIVIGGLGFPVLVDIYRHRQVPRHLRLHMHLRLHTRLTLAMTGVLLLVGLVTILGFEWSNPATLGPMSVPEKGLAGTFSAITPRTAGFNVIETGAMSDEGLLSTIVLMFIGAGSAGTSGGIKVGTFALIGLVIFSELRGSEDVNAFGRRIPHAVQRQATTVAALSMGVVVITTLAVLVSFDYMGSRTVLGHEVLLVHTLFEATSAFGTVGLSMGITPGLPPFAQLLVIGTMLIGRVGPATLGAALVLRRRPTPFRYPEEGPIIG